MSADGELARTLCLRRPGSAYRFTLSTVPRLDLRLSAMRAPAASTASGAVISGSVVVDTAGKLVFCAPCDPRQLLFYVSEWVKISAERLPAAAALVGGGAVRWDGAAPPDPASLKVFRDDRLWAGIAEPGPAQVSAVLAACAPGERLWYWLSSAPGAFGVPLLVQSVAADPNRDFLNLLIDTMMPGSPGQAGTGIAYAVEDGFFQFFGVGLERSHLAALAAWVRQELEDHPALGQLAGARLLRTARGKVAEVIDDPDLWDGVARPSAGGADQVSEPGAGR